MSITSWVDERIAKAIAGLDLNPIIDAAVDRVITVIDAKIDAVADRLVGDIAGIPAHIAVDVNSVAEQISRNIRVDTGDISSGIVEAIRNALPPFLRG